MTKYNNAYFPYSSVYDFSKTADGPVTSSNLPGWYVANGYQTGGQSPAGASCEASSSNVKFAGGALELIVPG